MNGEFKNPIEYHYEITCEKRGWSTSYNTYYTPFIRSVDKWNNVSKNYLGVDSTSEDEIISFIKETYGINPIRDDDTGQFDSEGNSIRVGDTLNVEMWHGETKGLVTVADSSGKKFAIHIGSTIYDLRKILIENKAVLSE